jgi:hypothetical protein
LHAKFVGHVAADNDFESTFVDCLGAEQITVILIGSNNAHLGGWGFYFTNDGEHWDANVPGMSSLANPVNFDSGVLSISIWPEAGRIPYCSVQFRGHISEDGPAEDVVVTLAAIGVPVTA